VISEGFWRNADSRLGGIRGKWVCCPRGNGSARRTYICKTVHLSLTRVYSTWEIGKHFSMPGMLRFKYMPN
jgi:hypothetical protein